MKRCKHCKWDSLDGDQPPCDMCVQAGKYRRKWWLRFAGGVPKVLLITLALVLGGCSQTIATYKDGVATVKRNRFLMTEDIGSFSYDATDGSFTLDGYKSDMTQALILINKLIAEKEEASRRLAVLGGKL